MEKKGKLELTWVGKYEEEKLEPRILIEDKSKSYGDPDTENMLIHGDNLLALKALERDYAGKIKCVYIDPPYNTGNAFEHYDDNLEHSIWLGMMRERLVLLHKLLCNEGFLCCHIDDSEGAYLKVLLDEIFGRQNYLTTIYVRVRYPEKTLKQDMAFHKEIEHIHVYRKSSSAQPILEKVSSGFEKFIYKIETEDTPSKILELGGKKVEIFKRGQYKILEEEGKKGTLADALNGADIFVGVSAPNIVTKEMVASMNKDAILFAMANPVPEIMPDLAKEAGAKVVGTGRSDFPNQVNNVVAFPGIFKGALEGRATKITEEMKLATAKAIASLVPDEELNENNILPEAFDPRVADVVSEAVKELI